MKIAFFHERMCYVCSTWSGPAWSPAQSLASVLISIQSLMNEKPYHNEPGFETVSCQSVVDILFASACIWTSSSLKNTSMFGDCRKLCPTKQY